MADVIAQGMAASVLSGLNNKLAKRPLLTGVRCAAGASDAAVWQAFTGQAPDWAHGFANYGISGSSYANNVGTFDQCFNQVQATITTNAGLRTFWAFPLATNTQTMAQVAAGTYDAVLTAMFQSMLAAQPNGNIFVRLGWEAGYGSGTPAWPWAITTPAAAAQYIATFQHVATLMRNLDPRFKAVWCCPLVSTDAAGNIFDPTGQVPLCSGAISAVSWASGQATFTTAALSTLPGAGANVTISGAVPTSLNGTWPVVSATSTSVVVTMPTNPGTYVAGGTLAVSEGYYPGNAYVDVIDMDVYMVGLNFAQNLTFAKMAYGPATLGYAGGLYGLRYLADFARAMTKPMGISEWGCGQDNPGFYRDMAAFLNDPANNVIYHGVWNRDASAPFTCRLTSDGSVAKPQSQVAYLAAFNGVGSALVEQSETSTFINRAPNVPSAVALVYRSEIDTLYAALKAAGLLQSLDFLYLLAGPDNDTTLLSLVTPGGGIAGYAQANYKASVTGAPTFAANSGWAGTGSTANYLNTGINLSTTPNMKASQNSCHLGAWFITANPASGPANSYDVGCAGTAIGVSSGGNFTCQPNYASSANVSSGAATPGHAMWNRTSAAAWQGYLNGSTTGASSGTQTSAAFQSRNLQIGYASGLQAGVNTIAAVHGGAALSANQYQNDPLAIYNALHVFLKAVGAVAS